jgi:Holliday junction resolvasome RuvABC endonuclease subunit
LKKIKRDGRRVDVVTIDGYKSNTVLGLDCSSSTIGWGLVSIDDLKLLSYGHIKPLPSKDNILLKRLDDTYERIQQLCESLNPTIVSVEDIFLFMRNRSQAQTITILTAFNRVAALAAYRKVGDVRYYSVHEIRKFIKNEHLPKSYKIGKEDMPNLIREHLEVSFKGPLNVRNTELAKEELDEADGISAAWSCAIDIRKKG